jgi:hypothetical protein
MGWLDYQLHEFRALDAAERNVVSIGIPTDGDAAERPVVPRLGSVPVDVLRSAGLALPARDVRVLLTNTLNSRMACREVGTSPRDPERRYLISS